MHKHSGVGYNTNGNEFTKTALQDGSYHVEICYAFNTFLIGELQMGMNLCIKWSLCS